MYEMIYETLLWVVFIFLMVIAGFQIMIMVVKFYYWLKPLLRHKDDIKEG